MKFSGTWVLSLAFGFLLFFQSPVQALEPLSVHKLVPLFRQVGKSRSFSLSELISQMPSRSRAALERDHGDRISAAFETLEEIGMIADSTNILRSEQGVRLLAWQIRALPKFMQWEFYRSLSQSENITTSNQLAYDPESADFLVTPFAIHEILAHVERPSSKLSVLEMALDKAEREAGFMVRMTWPGNWPKRLMGNLIESDRLLGSSTAILRGLSGITTSAPDMQSRIHPLRIRAENLRKKVQFFSRKPNGTSLRWTVLPPAPAYSN